MNPTLTELANHPPVSIRSIVNEFNIQVATVNGSGSQTANTVLMRAIFQMGVPVAGKNLFPSNIAGLPTWFTIRVSKAGYVGRREEAEVLVAMNPESAREDIGHVCPGGLVVYDEPLALSSLRQDLTYLSVPFDKLVAPVCPDARLRKLVRNMIYDGVLARLLGIDMTELERALRKQFRKKPKAADLNWRAVQVGFQYAGEHLPAEAPFRVEPLHLTQGKIIVDGNSAAALGCVFAGVSVVSWYPITPSSSLCESVIEYLNRYRIDPASGKATFAVVQCEDEMAALGMAIGAGWAGARAVTSTSGPGISLMAELAGLAYYAEVPVVIFDIQRIGPSTGLPTRTSQGDLLSTAFLSHGDTRHILLFPGSVEECFTLGIEAFDLAEELQAPIFVMSDLDLGMNNWMAEKFPYPKDIRRGKVLSGADLDRVKEFARYRDIDGDGIPYRTLPGEGHPAAVYFTRGSGHNERAQYSERPEEYVAVMDRLNRKYETARLRVPPPELQLSAEARIGLIAFGSSHWAVLEGRDQLRDRHGLKTSYLRLRAYPFSKELIEFFERHDRIYIIEQNRDGQMEALIRLDLPAKLAARIRSVRHYDGLPITASAVVRQILAKEGEE
ncbi:MAG: 2-oxoacid:acceptor oxidoreductase subunit alpha [Acidobacteriota bacterium]